MIRRLIILLLIVGCDNSTEPIVCDEGLTNVDGECYYQSDLDVLQDIINNSQGGEHPPPSDLSPIELGSVNKWKEGRLVEFCNAYNTWQGCYSIYELSGYIPESIGNLTNLISLYIYNNQLTGSIPLEIGNLTNLAHLNLSHNQLTAVPLEIGNLTNLAFLYLAHNALTGSILPEIGNLTNLTSLELYHNQLTAVPPEIGNLTNLERLKLHSNQFSSVSDSICNLTNLSWSSGYEYWDFNIYNNQLCPPYPSCIEDYVGEQDTTNCVTPN